MSADDVTPPPGGFREDHDLGKCDCGVIPASAPGHHTGQILWTGWRYGSPFAEVADCVHEAVTEVEVGHEYGSHGGTGQYLTTDGHHVDPQLILAVSEDRARSEELERAKYATEATKTVRFAIADVEYRQRVSVDRIDKRLAELAQFGIKARVTNG